MIIVTGASGGIGQFLTDKFFKSGEIVYGTYNSNKKNIFLNENLSKVDITKPKEIERWIATFEHQLNNITLINCVGISYNSYCHKSIQEEWHHVIDVNLNGSFNVIRAFLPYMRTQKYGRIINLSSVVPQIGVAGTSAYAASKAALWGLTKSLAKENAALGVTINNLNLGYFDAGMITSIRVDLLDEIKKSIPAGRLGSPAEIFEVIKMLICVEYINGASIDINGGI